MVVTIVSIYMCDETVTCGRNRTQTSTVKMVALLLNADDNDDINAAIITAIIKPTRPTGRMFSTSLKTYLYGVAIGKTGNVHLIVCKSCKVNIICRVENRKNENKKRGLRNKA